MTMSWATKLPMMLGLAQKSPQPRGLPTDPWLASQHQHLSRHNQDKATRSIALPMDRLCGCAAGAMAAGIRRFGTAHRLSKTSFRLSNSCAAKLMWYEKRARREACRSMNSMGWMGEKRGLAELKSKTPGGR